MDDIEAGILEGLDVSGKDVAQLCCNNGRELLSVKNMGARRCVGFDGAPGFIAQARELAASGNINAEFVCTDVYGIPPSFNDSFDLVTITIGVLCWMPDLGKFFGVVNRLLKPGGVVFIYEQHPILDMIAPGKAGEPLEWELSYFTEEPYTEKEGLDYFGNTRYQAKPATSFSHTMSAILMAATRNGLGLSHFEEYPHHISNTWWNVEQAGVGLPMSYTLVMDKP